MLVAVAAAELSLEEQLAQVEPAALAALVAWPLAVLEIMHRQGLAGAVAAPRQILLRAILAETVLAAA